VDKACAPEPTRRYPSTTELRNDLLDVQHGRSVRQRWRREKRLRQAAWALAALAVLVASVLYLQSVRVRAAEKGLALLELEKAIRPPHTAGWSTTAWQIAGNAAAKFGFDTNLQSQAAASLAGLDAHCLYQTNGIGGSSVAFSPDGRWVLYGALQDPARTDAPGKAHLLDLTTTNLVGYRVPGEGPVAFLPGGTPVQLSTNAENRLALWQVGQRVPPDPPPSGSSGREPAPILPAADQSRLTSAATAHEVDAARAALRFFPLPAGETIGGITALALTTNAGFVAASGTNTAGQPFLAAWDGTTGKLLFPVAAARQSAASSSPGDQRRSAETPLRGQPATALAFTPDGSLLAAGHDSGEVLVWRVPNQNASANVEPRVPPALSESSPTERVSPASPLSRRDGRLYLESDTSPLARISASRLPIRSLAFCRDCVRDPLHPALEPQWLLPTGHSGGGVSNWEVPINRLRTRSLGAEYGVSTLAFNQDSTLLVSAGRHPTKVWDTATGREVLAMDNGDMFTGVAFSANGVEVAFSAQKGFIAAQLSVWKLENGRGIRTLRGLSHQVTRLCCSRNSQLVAAVSHDWQVGVSNAASTRLLHVFTVPRGTSTADNAGLAFSPDNSQSPSCPAPTPCCSLCRWAT
jgi:WD40 repeat protein